MTNKAYQYVTALMEQGSFSKAAKQLGVSQPYLSQFVMRIEAELEMPIIDRQSRPLALTEAGQCWYESERKVSAIRAECEEQMKDLREGFQGTVKVGITSYVEGYFLSRILRAFYQKYPKIRVQLHEGKDAEIEAMAEAGTLDFSFVTNPAKLPGVTSELIFRETPLLAVHEKSPLCPAARAAAPGEPLPRFPVSQLHGAPVIDMREGSRFHDLLAEILAKNRVKAKIVHQTDMVTAAILLAGAGMGVALTSSAVARLFRHNVQVRYFSIPGNFSLDVCAVYKTDRYLSRSARALIDAMKAGFAQKP